MDESAHYYVVQEKRSGRFYNGLGWSASLRRAKLYTSRKTAMLGATVAGYVRKDGTGSITYEEYTELTAEDKEAYALCFVFDDKNYAIRTLKLMD